MAGLVSLQPKVTASLSPTGVSRFGGPVQVQVPARASFSSVFVGKVLVGNDVVSFRIGQRKSGKFVVRMNWDDSRISTMKEELCEEFKNDQLMLQKVSVEMEECLTALGDLLLLFENTELLVEELRRNGEHEAADAADAADAKMRMLRQQVQELQGKVQKKMQAVQQLRMEMQKQQELLEGI